MSIVYLQEKDVAELLSNTRRIDDGFAYVMDGGDVIHVFLSQPRVIPSGIRIPVRFKNLNDSALVINEYNKGQDGLVVSITLTNNKVLAAAKFIQNDTLADCEVKYIPDRSELYSRSKGLLETEALARKTVAIVGLGSGGSPIATELAKAGIGNFVLIDFDRIELSNVARHVCGINDLGRLKTYAVRDLIWQKNPYAQIETLEIDVNENPKECYTALSKADIIMCASDNDKSRFLLNDISLKYKVPAIFGRAITRAIGGDVLRVRPYEGPCYNCLYSQNIRNTEEEVSQKDRQAKKFLPDYTSDESLNTVVQVGLASDIAPITNFMVKLALVELSRGTNSGLSSLEDDLISNFYIWANRREYVYEDWSKLEYNFNKPSVLRWYGARVSKDPDCLVCGL